jgi:hypothetical protein
MIARDPELAAAAREAIIEPRAAANRILFRRAIDRGEIASDVDIEALCLIGPAMVAYRTLMLREPVDRDFMITTIDRVILPAAFAR